MYFRERVELFVRRYHGIDWILFIVLSVILFFSDRFIMPHCRPFQWDDASINFSSKPNTFPTYTIGVIVLGVPFFYIGFEYFAVKPLRIFLGEPMSLYSYERKKIDTARCVESSWSTRGPIYAWIRAHLWATLLELFVVDMLKLYIGRLRPDYLSRLAKAGYTANNTTPNPQTDLKFYCNLMKGNSELKDGRMSFPSGHSSTYFAVFTILSLFLFSHLRPFARQGSFIRLVIALSPLAVAFLCAASRTRDNKHNFSDVNAGSILGISCALLAFLTCFREAGGPLTVYLARSEHDAEYMLQYHPYPDRVLVHAAADLTAARIENGLATATRALNYQSTVCRVAGDTNPTSHPLPEIQSFPRRERADSSQQDTTTVLHIQECEERGPNAKVLRGVLITEQELNESPESVPWL